jgi:hypothetical protein
MDSGKQSINSKESYQVSPIPVPSPGQLQEADICQEPA